MKLSNRLVQEVGLLRAAIGKVFHREAVLVCSGHHTKQHSVGGFNSNLFSQSSEGSKSKVQVSAGWVSLVASVWDLKVTMLTVSSHSFPSVHPLCNQTS